MPLRVMDHGIQGRDHSCSLEMAVRHSPDGAIVLHRIDCCINAPISSLKRDLTVVFGIDPAQQHWTVRGNVLKDEFTLESYGIHRVENPQIFVEKKHDEQV